jgi:hypothetical protein
MIRLFITSLTLQFWASPYHSMDALLLLGGALGDRLVYKLKVLDPGFPRDDPGESPPSRPDPSFPTDVPAPEPHDVPAPEPRDVPPPDPGKVPPVAKPRRSDQNPKPRPVP